LLERKEPREQSLGSIFFCFIGAAGWVHRVGIVRIGGMTVGFFCFSMAMERHLWYNESRRNELEAAV